jgi:hypothetical protein
MLSLTTTSCLAHGHPEFTLAFAPEKIIEADVRWFADTLERDVASGIRFEAGKSLQVGWMFTWLTALPDGTLGFEEPDMKVASPLTRQTGLTNALGHLRYQKDTLESVLPVKALAFPSIEQRCLVCTRFAPTSPFFVDRREPKDKDSGWIFACESDHDHENSASWQKTWLYSAVVGDCRRALPYLAFPPGSLIIEDARGSPAFFLNDKPLAIRKGSYVHLQMESLPLVR